MILICIYLIHKIKKLKIFTTIFLEKITIDSNTKFLIFTSALKTNNI